MQFLTVMFMVVIGAVIGWVTNILAIKLLFRPFKPYKLPIFNYEIQGLIPKRKVEIANTIGKTVEEELLSVEDILGKIIEDEDKNKIVQEIKLRIDKIIEDKMPPILPSSFKVMIKEYVDTVVEVEISYLINDLSDDLIDKAIQRIDIKGMVENRINAFEMEKIEEIVISIAKRELTHIERLGAILGGIIGFVQGVIVIMIR